MITKISSIKNLGIFQNFEWDRNVKDKDGRVLELGQINIIFGRNYSGKTTVSRIFGALENGVLPENYENPQFTLSTKDGRLITQANLTNHNLDFRVFNEDFVKENLSFLFDPNKKIAPFAILGADNAKIMKKIKEIESALGSNVSGKETGLYFQQANLRKDYDQKSIDLNNKLKQIDDILTNKATKSVNSIKNMHEVFGEIRYDITKLKKELEQVGETGYVVLSKDEKELQHKIIKEQVKTTQPATFPIPLMLNKYIEKSKLLLNQKLETSNKIKELVDDVLLNEWVKTGAGLLDKKNTCAFCGGGISDERWKVIHAHFDNETQKLDKELNDLIGKIEAELQEVKDFKIDKSLFYQKQQAILDEQEILTRYSVEQKEYVKSLSTLIDKLKEKKHNIIKQIELTTDDSSQVTLINTLFLYEATRSVNEKYSSLLDSDQKKAKEKLRLQEVYEFSDSIRYGDKLKEIHELRKQLSNAKTLLEDCDKKIIIKQEELQSQNRQLQDEEAGAKAVNKYLTNDFGHSSLELRAEKIDVDGEEKEITFRIYRKNKPAYNLSGGEQNLIAFCYFLAKLKDVDTASKKPIIWIDDPITSLDGNHIFFVHSLIVSEIITNEEFTQLFISTHNLDFLKYLHRLKCNKKQVLYLLVNQIEEDKSTIIQMPKYLKEYSTEFNYLFEEIYKCSKLTVIDDENYKTLYSFGNHARKFMEILMFYNFPYSDKDFDVLEKMEKFFGDTGKIPSLLTERVTNEYSHLAHSVERGQVPVDKSEIVTCAKAIIKALESYNKSQFDNLVKSITN